MDDQVGWARRTIRSRASWRRDSVPRYVDLPAPQRKMSAYPGRADTVMRVSGLAINDVVVDDGAVVGAVGWNLEDETPVTVSANAVILAAGGLTRLYARNSASVTMNAMPMQWHCAPVRI